MTPVLSTSEIGLDPLPAFISEYSTWQHAAQALTAKVKSGKIGTIGSGLGDGQEQNIIPYSV
jgi:hypothetical protein